MILGVSVVPLTIQVKKYRSPAVVLPIEVIDTPTATDRGEGERKVM